MILKALERFLKVHENALVNIRKVSMVKKERSHACNNWTLLGCGWVCKATLQITDFWPLVNAKVFFNNTVANQDFYIWPRHQRRLGTAWMVKHQAEEHHHPCWCTLIPIYQIPALSFPTTGALVPCELSSGMQPGVLVSWLKTLEFHLVFGEKPDDALIGSGRYLCKALMFSSDLNIGASHSDKRNPTLPLFHSSILKDLISSLMSPVSIVGADDLFCLKPECSISFASSCCSLMLFSRGNIC